MENSNTYSAKCTNDKAQYWLDKMANEKPSWFKITKNIIKSFLEGETIDLDGLQIKLQKSKLTNIIDIALNRYSNYKYGSFYTLNKPTYDESGKYLPRYMELTGKEIEALYKLHMANKKEVA